MKQVNNKKYKGGSIMITEYLEVVIVIGLLVLLGIIAMIKHHRSSMHQRVKEHSSELFQRYLIIAESVVETTVIKLNETMVKEFKKANDGKLSIEDGNTVLTTAVRQVKLILGSVFTEFISEYIGNFDEWLTQEIEKYVSLCKANYNVHDLYTDLKREGILK